MAGAVWGVVASPRFLLMLVEVSTGNRDRSADRLLRSLLVAIAVCFIHLAPVTLLVTREIWRDGTR